MLETSQQSKDQCNASCLLQMAELAAGQREASPVPQLLLAQAPLGLRPIRECALRYVRHTCSRPSQAARQQLSFWHCLAVQLLCSGRARGSVRWYLRHLLVCAGTASKDAEVSSPRPRSIVEQVCQFALAARRAVRPCSPSCVQPGSVTCAWLSRHCSPAARLQAFHTRATLFLPRLLLHSFCCRPTPAAALFLLPPTSTAPASCWPHLLLPHLGFSTGAG